MNRSFNKPLPASINTIQQVTPVFPINIGQIVRLFFQQPYNGGSVGSQFATMAAAQTLSTWTSLIAASDGTAIFYTPLMSNTKIAKPKPLQTGADSTLTYRGQPEFFGMGGSEFSGEYRGKDAPSLLSMQNIASFSQQTSAGTSNCSAYMLTDSGDVVAQGTQAGTVITNIQPVNFFNYWDGSMSTDGYASGTVVDCGLWLPPGWSDNLVIIPRTASFDLRLLS